ncbi:MAG: alpha-ketoglutarate-dependent dioxygenase AlkB, partial [Pseudomonadota bacterium]
GSSILPGSTIPALAEKIRPAVEKAPIKKYFSLNGGEVIYFDNVFYASWADEIFQGLLAEISWQQQYIKIYGRQRKLPRLTAWVADPQVEYKYSGIVTLRQEWTKRLLIAKQKVENTLGTTFNGALLNRYRDGEDSVSWHADNEPALGKHPMVASLSFGAARIFQMKHRKLKNEKLTIELQHGSLLVMTGSTQENWLHQVPKTRRELGERINVTFRRINS